MKRSRASAGRRVPEYEVIIVGGGPAGLSAALMLGRCRRRVLVCDDGRPRNASVRTMHGYLSRDGVNPARFLALGRRELARYGVALQRGATVSRIGGCDGNFIVTLADARRFTARKILIATGVRDELPAIAGLPALYGRSVHHCPYCDGWEWRDQPLAVHGRGKGAIALALKLRTWSAEIVICTNGRAGFTAEQRQRLRAHGIAWDERKIARLEGRRGRLTRIRFADGAALTRSAMFFAAGQGQRADLARRIGCEITAGGGVRTYRHEQTCVPGVYVAGDASRDVQSVIVAAAEGATAAIAINKELQEEEGLVI